MSVRLRGWPIRVKDLRDMAIAMSRLNVSITALACVETTTSPLLEDEYLLLHATSTATEIRTAIPQNPGNPCPHSSRYLL